MRSLLLPLAWLFFFSGLIASGALYRDFRDRSLLDQHGLPTTGTVLWSSRYSKPCSTSIRVAYTDHARRAFSNYFNVCTNQYRPGQSVDLIYLSSDPAVARLSTDESPASGHHRTIGLIVALCFMLVGAALRILVPIGTAGTQP